MRLYADDKSWELNSYYQGVKARMKKLTAEKPMLWFEDKRGRMVVINSLLVQTLEIKI